MLAQVILQHLTSVNEAVNNFLFFYFKKYVINSTMNNQLQIMLSFTLLNIAGETAKMTLKTNTSSF